MFCSILDRTNPYDDLSMLIAFEYDKEVWSANNVEVVQDKRTWEKQITAVD
jgi:hypothetical protein